MPDAMAAEVTRVVLTGKPKLMALDPSLDGIEAPDTDDKTPALPIHSGAAGYLSGTQPSLSNQAQDAIYWFGLVASLFASTGAAGLALYHRLRPRPPPSRVMRLLEIWLAVRSADAQTLEALELEADALLHASVRAGAEGEAEENETRLLSLVLPHVREVFRQRRSALAGLSTPASPATQPRAEHGDAV